MSKLIIVESPAKAKTIGNFLGGDYKVIASRGHIRDLPKHTFGIKIENNAIFTPEYEIDKEHQKIVDELKKMAKAASQVYIATDEDREGEAIGFHIAHTIGKDVATVPRIVFHEITKSAITHAIENPRLLDLDSVNAQQTRRLLDRIVGYKLSPLLSSKIQKGLSAGRVQSSALKIVVDRELEIRAFVPVVYYVINIKLDETEATLVRFDGKKLDKLTITTQAEADAIVERLKKESFVISSIENKQKKSKAPPPFMTSTLQQAASSVFGYSPKKTMSIAQKLYEGVNTPNGMMGVITYMRTDSLNLSKEAIESARDFIGNTFGEKYLPKKPNFYTTKSSSAQEAHEAIRAVDVNFTPEIAKRYLTNDEQKIYSLIYNRFLACQSEDAVFDTQSIVVDSPSGELKINGRKLVFDGFYRITGYDEKDELLPHFKEQQKLNLSSISNEKKQTEPPSRYSEASLIKTLEQNGIGRPSTYAPTISLLQDREYIAIEKKSIHPSEIAFKVIELLSEHFEEIVDAKFTAKMEETLDEIATNGADWQQTLAEFYAPFMAKIAEGKTGIKSQKIAIPTGEMCPECGKELMIRAGRYGEFVSCSNYPKCKYTKNIGEEKEQELELTDVMCDKCGAAMVIKNSRRGKFYACSAYPKCKNTKSLKAQTILEVPCPKCGGNIIERISKRGKFYGCGNYPKCDFISNYPLAEEKCTECGSYMVKKELKKGNFVECANKECKHKVEIL